MKQCRYCPFITQPKRANDCAYDLAKSGIVNPHPCLDFSQDFSREAVGGEPICLGHRNWLEANTNNQGNLLDVAFQWNEKKSAETLIHKLTRTIIETTTFTDWRGQETKEYKVLSED